MYKVPRAANPLQSLKSGSRLEILTTSDAVLKLAKWLHFLPHTICELTQFLSCYYDDTIAVTTTRPYLLNDLLRYLGHENSRSRANEVIPLKSFAGGRTSSRIIA